MGTSARSGDPAPLRDLEFGSIDEVMPEVERLLEGHRTLGNWSLGQICWHLADAFRLSVDGFPNRAPWLVRKTIGPIFLGRMLRVGRFPRGLPVPGGRLPPPGLDARGEADSLRSAIATFLADPAERYEHPVGGALDRAGAVRLHLIHCAHHLRFVAPAGAVD